MIAPELLTNCELRDASSTSPSRVGGLARTGLVAGLVAVGLAAAREPFSGHGVGGGGIGGSGPPREPRRFRQRARVGHCPVSQPSKEGVEIGNRTSRSVAARLIGLVRRVPFGSGSDRAPNFVTGDTESRG